MIDFHTHVLPGIDDGSSDIAMTERMLEMETQQGVTHVYATPHFYAHRRSVRSFLDRREGALAKVRELLARREDLPRISVGAEVYYFGGMGRAEQLQELCIEGTDLLLLEMPFTQWTSDMVKDVRDIRKKQGLRIILAHVERYEGLQKHRSAWEDILSMPVTIQMNSGSFIASSFRKHTQKFCLGMLNDYEDCIIGTDCHNLTDRAPNLAEARKVIEKKAGRVRLELLDRYTEKLLGV